MGLEEVSKLVLEVNDSGSVGLEVLNLVALEVLEVVDLTHLSGYMDKIQKGHFVVLFVGVL